MKKIILASLLCVGSLAQAQDQSATSSTLQFSREAVETNPRGLIPFIGAGGGYTGYGENGTSAQEGTPGTVKLLGSYYFESPWVSEFGYGFNSQSFSQSTAKDSSINNAAIELAARYRSENRWQTGVVADQMFGQGGNYAAEQEDAQFVGLQVLKEFNLAPAWLGRVGGRAMALTNNTGNEIYMYLVDLQIGWNPNAYKASAKSAEAKQAEPEMLTERESTPVLRDVAYSSLATAGAIQFSSGKYSVSNADKKHLAKVAKVLNEHSNLLERVEVVGYTDSTGSTKTNDRLSQARAEQVKAILQKNGLKDVPVTAVGKGSSEATGGSMRADRRTELVFVGVKDEEALRNALASIQ
ncbi:OmpA family protein [Bdellovibrio svalbardensis]|uniref:OmpA family protein n=1 Tax=Bdellovibrio svalbardensis TaxID=2972972 RepID=A0ABT6DN68_9BACT|nr:OmpA family protein [Bdellovibrio svalbardensis]MDG0818064.1 OmpA family protein [Bdellovibrio svalbardensis]